MIPAEETISLLAAFLVGVLLYIVGHFMLSILPRREKRGASKTTSSEHTLSESDAKKPRTQATPDTPAVAAESLIPYRYMAIRRQWRANFGYCGETSLQTAGLYYGQYLSQYDVREAGMTRRSKKGGKSNTTTNANANGHANSGGGGLRHNQERSQVLLGVNDETCARALRLTCETWDDSAFHPQHAETVSDDGETVDANENDNDNEDTDLKAGDDRNDEKTEKDGNGVSKPETAATTSKSVASETLGSSPFRSVPDQFYKWVAHHARLGQPVIIGVYMNQFKFYKKEKATAGDDEYDHIVSVVGVKPSSSSASSSPKSSPKASGVTSAAASVSASNALPPPATLILYDNGLWQGAPDHLGPTEPTITPAPQAPASSTLLSAAATAVTTTTAHSAAKATAAAVSASTDPFLFTYPTHSFARSRREANSKETTASVYSLPDFSASRRAAGRADNYGIAITGVADDDGVLLRVQVTTVPTAAKMTGTGAPTTTPAASTLSSATSNGQPQKKMKPVKGVPDWALDPIILDQEPEMPRNGITRPTPPVSLTLRVHVWGMQRDVAYTLYKYIDINKVPPSAFNARREDAVRAWKVKGSGGAEPYVITEEIMSNEMAIYRCVPDSAP